MLAEEQWVIFGHRQSLSKSNNKLAVKSFREENQAYPHGLCYEGSKGSLPEFDTLSYGLGIL